MGVATLLLTVVVFATISSCIDGSLITCERKYRKIGCYKDKRSDNKDLIVYDRYGIQWHNIEKYLHNLACQCSQKVEEVNNAETKAGRKQKYAGFSLHYFGECYGHTADQLKSLESRALGYETHCIGDQTYTTCEMGHNECTGTDEAEYIYEMKSESSQEVNVDGGYADWEKWTPCVPSCGKGVRLRERTCTKPKPKGNGKDCSSIGSTTEQEICNNRPCPVNGEFTKWTDWGNCDKECGGGVQKRTRTCTNPPPAHGGKNCVGNLSEQKSCNQQACPVNGGWSDWGAYGQCSKSCGGGKRKRFRGCTKPSPQNGGLECSGKDTEEEDCNKHNCPVHGGYSLWSGYSSCSKTCGTGTKTRRRYCNNPPPAYGGGDCSIFGTDIETKYCNTHACPVPISSEYTARTCEGGTMHISCSRSRKIMITYASYGRKTKRHCGRWHDLFWSTSCHASSSWGRVTNDCDGRSSCGVPATNGKFGDPCWGTFKYLAVRYRCKG